jgi:chaperone modulatory protein CbpM
MTQSSKQVLQAEIAWLTLAEFSEVSGLSSAQVRELVEIGVLAPSGTSAQEWHFNHRAMTLARRLRRLQEDLDIDLDLQAVALGYRLLERISELESQLCREQAARRID